MNIVKNKNQGLSGYFVGMDSEVELWGGTLSIRKGTTTVFTCQLNYDSTTKRLSFNIIAADLSNLETGLYDLVTDIVSADGVVSVQRVDMLTLNQTLLASEPMTTIFMTILKSDGTPAGKEIKDLKNTSTGAEIAMTWKGVTVTASHTVADEVSGVIIGTETISTETNAAGYAQLAVIKGQTVTVSCPSFGKTVTVDTTGHDAIDLSSYF